MQHGDIEHLFKATEVDLYKFVYEFSKAYHALPSPETIKAHTDQSVVDAKEPPAYYFDLMQLRHTELELKRGMKKASDLLLPANKDPEQALRVMADMCLTLMSKKSNNTIVDFRKAYGLIMQAYAEKMKLSDSFGLRLGWPTLDEMTGGLRAGDLVSYVGRPGQGKTSQMLWGMMHGWIDNNLAILAGDETAAQHQQSRLFVSMEMPVVQIMQNMAAMLAHIPAGQLKKGALSTVSFQKLKNGLTQIDGFPVPFWVVDGNLTSTVEDIWVLATQLNPAAIAVDGGYLVKHPKETDRYRRVAENVELMKSELAPIAPTVASWQFARPKDKSKKAKSDTPTLDDIGYTDAIAQVSSLVLALLQQEHVDTIVTRRVDILKGRNGETGSFVTFFDWLTMNFGEVVQATLDQLQIE